MLQKMEIFGGERLVGEISISGAKNLALPAIAASLLTDSEVILRNVPRLVDVNSMLLLMNHLGVESSFVDSHTLSLCTSSVKSVEAPYDFVRKMRASILVLGPLVSRYGKASVSLPGGCAIGSRGVDLHIAAIARMGADVSIENGYINASAPNGLVGCDITFQKSTVTGTENVMMAATLAHGKTRLINAAIEPEVTELAEMLNTMGAKISGHGTSVVSIDGVDSLHGTDFEIAPDRIEAGTYAIASAVTNGSILLKNCRYQQLSVFFEVLNSAGIKCSDSDGGVLVSRENDVMNPVDIQTAPYPGFPTDLQAQYMTLMTICNGTSSITENIFENRFMHVPELSRMGANISIHGNAAIVTGVDRLKGTSVMATDLRASVSLVLAGLMASGKTTVNRLYHIDRGYEDIDHKLESCGAKLTRKSE